MLIANQLATQSMDVEHMTCQQLVVVIKDAAFLNLAARVTALEVACA
jgi:hypothetical protein